MFAMQNKAPSIVIVGGGTSGWMAATYIAKLLENYRLGGSVTLVESKDVGTIGVGEATIPTIKRFFQFIGFPEADLFAKTNATIKSAICFKDWLHVGHHYYHPFEAPALNDGVDIVQHWVAESAKGHDLEPYAEATGIIAKLCAANKVPKLVSSREYDGPNPYAYHLDAKLLADSLKSFAIDMGVEAIEAMVSDVELDDRGNIKSLHTDNNQILAGDFFIDCTGFKGLLIEQVLKSDFVSYADDLLCNAAVAVPSSYAEGEDLRSYTLSQAQAAGWIWQIDLASRQGNGYVYANDFISSDEALSVLMSKIGKPVNEADAKVIKMRVGRRREFWKNNCLSIGLSGGFIEPLESTGLQFIEIGLKLFGEYFPFTECNHLIIDEYNDLMMKLYDETKDFIVLHYHLSNRQDSEFWRYASHENRLSDKLKMLLNLWQHKLPSYSDMADMNIFNHINYQYILGGMKHLVPKHNQNVHLIDSHRSQMMFNKMMEFQHRALQVSPTQRQFINQMNVNMG